MKKENVKSYIKINYDFKFSAFLQGALIVLTLIFYSGCKCDQDANVVQSNNDDSDSLRSATHYPSNNLRTVSGNLEGDFVIEESIEPGVTKSIHTFDGFYPEMVLKNSGETSLKICNSLLTDAPCNTNDILLTPGEVRRVKKEEWGNVNENKTHYLNVKNTGGDKEGKIVVHVLGNNYIDVPDRFYDPQDPEFNVISVNLYKITRAMVPLQSKNELMNLFYDKVISATDNSLPLSAVISQEPRIKNLINVYLWAYYFPNQSYTIDFYTNIVESMVHQNIRYFPNLYIPNPSKLDRTHFPAFAVGFGVRENDEIMGFQKNKYGQLGNLYFNETSAKNSVDPVMVINNGTDAVIQPDPSRVISGEGSPHGSAALASSAGAIEKFWLSGFQINYRYESWGHSRYEMSYGIIYEESKTAPFATNKDSQTQKTIASVCKENIGKTYTCWIPFTHYRSNLSGQSTNLGFDQDKYVYKFTAITYEYDWYNSFPIQADSENKIVCYMGKANEYYQIISRLDLNFKSGGYSDVSGKGFIRFHHWN